MFKTLLQEILDRINHSIGVLVLDSDGLVIDKFIRWEKQEIENLAIECINLIKETRLLSLNPQVGAVEELILQSEKMQFILRAITPEHFLILLMKPQGFTGLARYQLAKSCFKLEKELL
ncbi:hypothetical protein CEE39_03365 [bacterium (candidate division B38) B3_B38]|nr:MAG: hypothetical protein CEE39_03365 [bacterium (candidate division B38) B3_B38]